MTNWKEYFNRSSNEYECINNICESINKRLIDKSLYYISDDIVQSDVEYLDGLIKGDHKYDSMINMLKAVICLTYKNFFADGKKAIKEALRLDDSINFNDKFNLQLAYEAKEADCLEDFERIVSRFKNHKDNWFFVNYQFSFVVSTSLDDGGYIFDAFDNDVDKKTIRTAHKAFEIKTNLPNPEVAADGWADWVDFCIMKNDDNAFYCAQTAYETYSSLTPVIDHIEACWRETISYSMMGRIAVGLAKCYYIGLGTGIDYKKAFSLFTEAYEKCYCSDGSYLAECYTLGHGTDVDLNKAVELYQKEIDKLQESQSEYNRERVATFEGHIKEIQSGKYNNNRQESKGNVNLAEQEYLEEYKCMLEDGEIGPRERKSLGRLCTRLGLSAQRASELEASVGISNLSEEELEYIDEYREIRADGEIRDRDRRALERLAHRNGISASRAAELEKLA